MNQPRRWAIGCGIACATVLAGMVVWRAGTLPIAETRHFLTTPMVVGDAAPSAPASVHRGTLAERGAAARAAFVDGRWAEAAEAYAAVVAADPTGPTAGPAQWHVVRSRLRSGDANAALTGLRDLLANHAGWIGAEAPDLRDGAERMARGDLAGARTALERAIAAQPDGELVPLAHALLARVHWAHGDATGMVRAFARMLGSVRDAVPAYARLAHYLGRYADGDPDVADDFRALATTGDAGFRDIYQYLAARTLLEQGRSEATAQALEQLRRDHPGGDFTSIVDLEHAWNHLRHGRAADALAIFQRLEATPTPDGTEDFDAFFDLRAELPMGIARSLAALGRHDEAVGAFERAIAADPQGMYRMENRLGLASAYERLGRLDQAAATLATVVAEHPDEPSVWAIRQQLARVEALAHRTP